MRSTEHCKDIESDLEQSLYQIMQKFLLLEDFHNSIRHEPSRVVRPLAL